MNPKEVRKLNIKQNSDFTTYLIIMSVGPTPATISLPCFHGFNQFAVWPAPQSVSKLFLNVRSFTSHQSDFSLHTQSIKHLLTLAF